MEASKIISALLALKFPGIELKSLLTVVEATSDPVVATEILCGIYERPKFDMNKTTFTSSRFNNEQNITFISYDKFSKRITYSYQTRKRREQWNHKGLVLPFFNSDPGALGYYSREDVAKSLQLEMPIFLEKYEKVVIYGDLDPAIKQNTCPVEDWNK